MRFHPLPSALGALVLSCVLLSACADVGEPGVPERIVAIGDLHGDLEAARAALSLGGAIDAEDNWIGGDLVVVQIGDILDRGDQERAIIELFRRLGEEADGTGGAVHLLNGNHELMHAYHDFRYVTEGGWADYQDVPVPAVLDSFLDSLEVHQRPRATAFRPGGPSARILAEQKTALIIGSSLFTHGAILPFHVDLGIDEMNSTVRAWLLDEVPQPEWIRGDHSPVWGRLYSNEPNIAACDTLSMVLDRLGVERIVVGHTVQRTGITAYCGGRVWCIDVGLAAHYGGRPEVLEIRGDVVKSLR